ncbi:MAG TPA: class I SAM-dependent methyltransferase [Gemmatimonadaceae bacterium]|nr:class I SAM-dependent methyltransferase [Gemmatimonadaceae bacterium]
MTQTSTSTTAPQWLVELFAAPSLDEGVAFSAEGQALVVRRGIPRTLDVKSPAQEQTSETFGFKWRKRNTFDSPASLARMREWLIERYGDVPAASWLSQHGSRPLLIDAGCGAGMSGLELLGPLVPRVRYLAVDVSEAVDVARERFAERGLDAGFLQADVSSLPLPPESVDLVFSEGVLHHTNSTEGALKSLARLLKPGGRFLFYVYRRKGPVREFTDDLVRDRLQSMSTEEAWKAMEPITQLGISLGRMKTEIDIPAPIELLGIPAGRISVQRLFYWHVAKMFYGEDLTFDEMNHINFDWYAPSNAHRQTPDEVRSWCKAASMEIERFVVEDAGITVIARKQAPSEFSAVE